MPCICWGAISGEEEFDDFLKSEMGHIVMESLKMTAQLIKDHKFSTECTYDYQHMEFRQMFVKAFLHMLVGCDEEAKPKL